MRHPQSYSVARADGLRARRRERIGIVLVMDDLDLAAAQLRADGGDLSTFVEVLAVRLEDALPGMVEVRRRRAGLLSSRREVEEICCRLGDDAFTLTRRRGEVTAQREKTVRGIRLKTEQLPVAQWVDALLASVGERAQTSDEAYRALKELLG